MHIQDPFMAIATKELDPIFSGKPLLSVGSYHPSVTDQVTQSKKNLSLKKHVEMTDHFGLKISSGFVSGGCA